MSLTNRLCAFFLVALAVVLVGFSATLLLFARSYLHRQLDERLEAAANTLAAVAEVEDTGIEWDLHDRRLQVGGIVPDASVQWTVHSEDGKLLDASQDLRDKDPLRRELKPSEPVAGFLEEDAYGEDRRCLRQTLSLEPPTAFNSEPSKHLHSKLVFTVAASEKPNAALLERLSSALVASSLTVWAVALFFGRRFCRRALRPVADMAEQAATMNARERGERLRVPPSHDELEALGHSFNGLLNRLHEAMERQRRFTGDASHQLRTPLTALLGQVEVALRHPRSVDEYRALLTQVQQQGQHLNQIVEMLLYLARADAEGRLENLTPLDLRDWIPEHLQNWSRHPRFRDLQLATTPPSCLVRAQPPMLGQLLDNLIDNAFKYSPPGSPVLVQVNLGNNDATVSVEDRGIGIAEIDLPHLFEPFYRAESVRSLGRGGVGLGLSIAARIAHLFGGELVATRNKGPGSRFTLKLPRLDTDAKT